MPSPSSNTTTSGLPEASSLSMVRVSAGPLVRVVVTTPRSVKIAQRRAPASSMARMSRRSETPVALKASTVRPRWRMRVITAQAAAGQLEGVVGRLVVEDLDHDDDAFLGGNVGGDAHLVRQSARLGHRGQLVDHHAAHVAEHGYCSSESAAARSPARV